MSKLSRAIRYVRTRLAAPFKPAIMVAGLGRCGTTLVYDAIAKSSRVYSRADRFVVDLSGFTFHRGTIYKTHDFPPNCLQCDIRTIFMFGNPMNAAISAHKHFMGDSRRYHYRNVHSPHADDHGLIFEKDVLLLEEHFDRWMQPQSFPFFSLSYESLYDGDVLEMLNSYVGLRIQLPARQQRQADWRKHPDRDRLHATYARLADKILAAPKAKVWNQKVS